MSSDESPEEFADLAAMLAAAQAANARPAVDLEAAAARRRRRKRRGIVGGAVSFIAVAAAGAYVTATLLAPLPATAGVVDEFVAPTGVAVELALPEVGASAVSVTGAPDFAGTVGVDGILASRGGDEARPIASISKIITTLVILEAKPLGPTDAGPTITFSKADNDLYDKYYVMGATIQHMKIGSTMSQRDALELMLVASASNYAEAVSTWAFGSQANFRAAATSWLAAKGLTGTTIVEPTGIDPRNTSTPTDLIALGRLALADPVVAALVQLQNTDVPGFTGIPNNNTLLGTEGINGIKTGTLDEAGACLLFSAIANVGSTTPITIVGVVLGASDHYYGGLTAQAIIHSITRGFHTVPLLTIRDTLGTYSTPWGDEARIVPAQSAGLLTWSDAPITSTMTVSDVTQAKDGTKVGSITFTAENRTVTVPLVLDGSITAPDAWWRITHPQELFGARVGNVPPIIRGSL